MKYIFLFFITLNSFALTCPDHLTDKDIAKQLVEVELSGVRVSDMEDSYCLKQGYHPNILVSYDAPVEEELQAKYFVKNDVEIKITKVVLIDKDSHSYEAFYELQAMDEKGKAHLVKSSIKYMKNVSAIVQKTYGCASVLEGPAQTTIYKRCKK
jgi:hypothetical protein